MRKTSPSVESQKPSTVVRSVPPAFLNDPSRVAFVAPLRFVGTILTVSVVPVNWEGNYLKMRLTGKEKSGSTFELKWSLMP
jgi:hypothetical protein